MKRIATTPRDGWRDIVTAQGLTYHTAPGGEPYWNEGAYYELTGHDVDVIEAATIELNRICLDAARHVIENDLLGRIGVPERVHDLVRWSWRNGQKSVYGRFDLAYDGVSPPKMLEYNADTPTTLIEGAVAQWYWLQDCFPNLDQYNSIWEGLVGAWRSMRIDRSLEGDPLYFASGQNDEDWMTISLLRDTAEEAGISTEQIFMRRIGWDAGRKAFVDEQNRVIKSIFKLYPWEWILTDEFGCHALETYKEILWIEPIWRFVLSCKGILSILWELFPDHPNLVPSFMTEPDDVRDFVSKPVISREGTNVLIHDGTHQMTPGRYAAYPRVYQQLCPIPSFEGNYPVIGSWMIGGKSHGIGIREADSVITNNLSRFVPHILV